jgi:hypothetical protein
LPPALPEGRQGAAEPNQAIVLSINGAAAVGPPNRQQSATIVPNGGSAVSHQSLDSDEHVCAECGGPIVGRRRGALYCSDSCRVKSAGKAFRERQKAQAKAPAGSGHGGDRISEQAKADQGDTANLERNTAARLQRRRVTDAALVVHPDAPERPFRSDESEPDWLRVELAPPRLACEG